ncbi:hypothetical protein B0H16DRAFT_1647661 [Mycena metata]|uniref:F-box domain-containing protein n=1 Tax=Mycena metata TaxID=1033252 RepID=A0AAD7DP20_9AGAR|nr:hypothetical protein B0H16DRAFT_1647661 [Mycena metata]
MSMPPPSFIPSHSPRLPGELVDMVIDHLKSDKSALIACSRVSRIWVPRSRRYRFATISFRVVYLEDADGSNERQLQQIHKFLVFAKSPLATFIAAVTEVRIEHRSDLRFTSPMISPERILAGLERCGIRPTRLYLNCYTHLESWVPTPPFGPSLASSVVHLHLALDDNLIGRGALLDYVSAFRLLESLTLTGTPKNVALTFPTALAWPTNLHTLHNGHNLITTYLLGLDPVPTRLTHLYFGLGHGGALFNEYLQNDAAAHITSLALEDSVLPLSPDDSEPNCAKLRRLRHLAITARGLPSSPGLFISPDLLIGLVKAKLLLERILGSPAFCTLETITLSATFRPFFPTVWLDMDALLADAEAWPRLRRVTLTVSPEYRRKYIDTNSLVVEPSGGKRVPLALELHRLFARCEARGLLVVDIPILKPSASWNEICQTLDDYQYTSGMMIDA